MSKQRVKLFVFQRQDIGWIQMDSGIPEANPSNCPRKFSRFLFVSSSILSSWCSIINNSCSISTIGCDCSCGVTWLDKFESFLLLFFIKENWDSLWLRRISSVLSRAKFALWSEISVLMEDRRLSSSRSDTVVRCKL